MKYRNSCAAVAVSLSVLLSLGGCSTSGVYFNSDVAEGSSVQESPDNSSTSGSAENESTSSSEATTSEPDVTEPSEEVTQTTQPAEPSVPIEDREPNSFYHWQVGSIELTDEQWQQLDGLWQQVEQSPVVNTQEAYNDQDFYFNFTYNGENHEITAYCNDYEQFFLLDHNKTVEPVYALYDFLDDVTASENSVDGGNGSASDRLYSYTYPCSEPIEDEEYIAAAKGIVSQWLESLKSETGEYSIQDYSMSSRRHESELLGTGIINGRKEFAVFVAIDVEGTPEDTVFDEPGTYDLFYHYYFGECVYARFCWENGECRLIDWEKAYAKQTGSRIEEGLNGINVGNPQYETFFEFLRDTEQVKYYEDNAAYRMYASNNTVVTKNAVMLSDGDIFLLYIDVDEYISRGDGTMTGKMGQSFFDITGDPCYQSPVEYNNEMREPYVLSFTEGFRFAFDDYNCDGNPDYALQLWDGSFEILCLDADGSPRAAQRDFDSAVYSGDSPLLQIIDSGKVVAWTEERGEFVPQMISVGNNATTIGSEVDDYRMYSERFYMPQEFRSYSSDTDVVYLRYWNNTSAAAATSPEYTIQRRSSDGWEDVFSGTIEPVTAQPYSHAEIAVDVSQISSSIMSEYRVVFEVEGKAVYGGFYMGSETLPQLSVTCTEQAAEGRVRLTYKLCNDGFSQVKPDSAVLYKNGTEIYRFDKEDIPSINIDSGEALVITARHTGEKFQAGEYTLKVTVDGNVFEGTITLLSTQENSRSYFGGTAEAKRTENGISLTLKNTIWNKSDAKELTLTAFEVFSNDEWRSVQYYFIDDESTGFDGSSPYYIISPFAQELKYGDSLTVELTDYYEEFNGLFSDYYDLYLEELPEGTAAYTYEEFLEFCLWMAYPETGEQCRVTITTPDSNEYVYFVMP